MGIDFIRSLVVCLVTIGHIWQGHIMKSFPRYLIYSVHIPLFLGLSGSLLRFDKLKKPSIKAFIDKYYIRFGITFLMTVIFYYTLMC